MIDRDIKRCLGQMITGVQVVAASHEGETRAYCSHWVSQVSFDEPVVLASVSPKHDTHPLIVRSGRFAVSVLAADQVEQAQYFSYPGRRFRQVATEWLTSIDSWPVVPDSIAWLGCEVFERIERLDHDLFLATVTSAGEGRLGEPPLLYSSRKGWRETGGKVRRSEDGIRDRLLARLDETGSDAPG